MSTTDLETLKTAILHAPIGICLLDARSLTAEIANDKFLEVAGKPADAIIGKFYWDAFAEARQYYEAALNEVVQSGKPYFANEVELPLIRNGREELVFVSFVYSPIKDPQGKVLKVAVWVLENTVQVKERQKVDLVNRQLADAKQELEKTFHQLEENEIALRLALSAANVGTWFIRPGTREFVTDARVKELFGFRPEEHITIEDALAQINDEYRELVADALDIAIYKGGDFDVTFPVTGFGDQQLRWLRAIGNLKADPSGEFSSFTGMVMDITKQKLEEQRKNDFIGMVSHELKTPLASLNGYLQLLQRRDSLVADDFAKHSLEQSVKQVKKMTTMINGFLNISRFEAGKIHIDKSWFNMALLFTEIEQEVRAMINTHQVIFEPLDSIFVNADRDKIGQVINNLISNAVKYSQAGTTIHISCNSQHDKVQVCVKDQGVGVHRSDLHRLFERFYRAHHNNHIAGFGIGLYLCSEIIQRHDGEIWVESEIGEGARFYFNLPIIKQRLD